MLLSANQVSLKDISMLFSALYVFIGQYVVDMSSDTLARGTDFSHQYCAPSVLISIARVNSDYANALQVQFIMFFFINCW